MEYDKQDESPDHGSSGEKNKTNRSSTSEDEKNPNSDKLIAAQNQPAPQLRVCDFCGKTFTSGKALGGHRRFHFQALRKAAEQARKVKIRTPLSLKTSSNNSDDVKMDYALSEDGKPTCCLCNKDFPSMKSLFGHMRSHPERDWRGVFPPLTSERNSNSSSSDSDSGEQKKEENDLHCAVIAPSEQREVVDLLKDLQSWQKTARRGRMNIGAAEAAENLVHLSRGIYLPCEFRSDVCGRHHEEPGKTPISSKKRKIKELPTRKYVRKIKVEEENIEEKAVGEESEKSENVKMIKKKKKRELKLRCQSSESVVDTSVLIKNLKVSDGYKCGVCGRSFPTFQALGGHKSSHNKERNSSLNADESRPSASSSETLAISQAVGENHQTSRGMVGPELSSEVSAGEASSTQSGPPMELEDDQSLSSEGKIMDFDLNEPYFMEDAEATK